MEKNKVNTAAKKTAKKNKNNSKKPIKQGIKAKRGPKPGATITKIIDRRDIIEKAFLELYMINCLNASPENGLATLARFLHKREKFQKKNGKRISVNTIRHDLIDLLKESKYTNPRNRKRK